MNKIHRVSTRGETINDKHNSTCLGGNLWFFVTHTMQLCLNTLIIIINIQYIYVQVRYKPVSIQPGGLTKELYTQSKTNNVGSRQLRLLNLL